MLKALPILIILGLAIYSFFDVLKTPDLLIKHGPKAMWMVLALVPVIGAALWFLLARPGSDSDAHPPPRVSRLRRGPVQVAPDDDVSFLRRLDDEAWLRKRQESRSRDRTAEAGGKSATEAAPGSDNAATDAAPESTEATPASGDSSSSSDEATDRKTQPEEQSPGEQDL